MPCDGDPPDFYSVNPVCDPPCIDKYFRTLRECHNFLRKRGYIEITDLKFRYIDDGEITEQVIIKECWFYISIRELFTP